MIISAAIFEAYLKCPSKCWFLFLGKEGDSNVYLDFVRNKSKVYRSDGIERLMVQIQPSECVVTPSLPVNIKTATWLLAVDFVAIKETLKSRLHAVERVPADGQGKSVQIIPIRFIFTNKLTKSDKLMLAFDALVLSEMLRIEVSHGKIIYGNGCNTLKIKTSALTGDVKKITGKIVKLIASESPPALFLNRHCVECEYQARCRHQAIEKDDLSLLAGMTEKERKKLNSKGTPVYLDVEEIPDLDFYYLIGMRIRNSDSVVQHSLWAENPEEGKKFGMIFLVYSQRLRIPFLYIMAALKQFF